MCRKYGQLASTEAVAISERVLYQLPNGAIDDPAKTLGLMRNTLKELKDGGCDEPDDQHSEQNKSSFVTNTSSQLDDWLHRGDHPIVKHMSLYIYGSTASKNHWLEVLMPRHPSALDISI